MITSIFPIIGDSGPILYLVEMDRKIDAWPRPCYEDELELVS